MPVSPALAENLAQALLDQYRQAEAALINHVALRLQAGIDAPGWAEKKLAEVQELRRQTELLIADLEKEAAEGVSTALAEAYANGGRAAASDLAPYLKTNLSEGAPDQLAGLGNLEALTRETLGHVTATHPRILRATVDAYRDVISQTASQVLLGTQTRRQAAQQALNRFAERGITGFVDRAGRGWNLDSYVEMAMRTGTGKAAVQGHMDELQANGFDLVIISDAPRECRLCAAWEGRVLSIKGGDPEHPSLADARAQGLFHANCRHSASLYIEGVTRPYHQTADPEGYKAAQKQRYLERQIRASKRMEAAALDETALKKAKARTRAYQAKLREHVAANDLKRLRYREQVRLNKTGLVAPKATGPSVTPSIGTKLDTRTQKPVKNVPPQSERIRNAKIMHGDFERDPRILRSLPSADLRVLAREYGLSSSGTKKELLSRIQRYLR